MPNATITVTARETDKNPRQLRLAGKLPGSVYGKGMDAVSIQMDTHDFEIMYKRNKDATWELDLNGKKFNAKIQELQMNFATSEFLNVEFQAI